MSKWITDREPTVEDADYQHEVWVTTGMGSILRKEWSAVEKGEPWMPITPPEPYVKPKQWTVDKSDVNPIEKPKGKVYIKATGANRYMGGDSNWHLITGFEYEEGISIQPKDVKSIRATFTWRGERNGMGVGLDSDGGAWLRDFYIRNDMDNVYKRHGLTPPPPGPNLVAKKDSPSGQPITLKRAYEIITGT